MNPLAQVNKYVLDDIHMALDREPCKLPRPIVYAWIEQESSFNPRAFRFEPNYKWLYKPEHFAKHWNHSVGLEILQQKTSWGLTQLMGAVVREHFPEFKFPLPEALTNPFLSTLYGVRWLNRQFDRAHGNINVALAMYNGGRGAVISGITSGEFKINNFRSYVEPILKKAEKYHA